jgi:hypothetical protein
MYFLSAFNNITCKWSKIVTDITIFNMKKHFIEGFLFPCLGGFWTFSDRLICKKWLPPQHFVVLCHGHLIAWMLNEMVYDNPCPIMGPFTMSIPKETPHHLWHTPKLLDRLNCKSKCENNRRTQSWGMLPNLQHFESKKTWWSSGMGTTTSDKRVNYSHELAQTKQQVS